MNLFVSPFLVFFLNVHIWFLLAAAATSSLVLLVPSITWELLQCKIDFFLWPAKVALLLGVLMFGRSVTPNANHRTVRPTK